MLTLVFLMIMRCASLEYSTALETRNMKLEESIRLIHEISSGATGTLCVTKKFKHIPVRIDHSRWRYAQTRTDMAAALLRKVGFKKKELLEALAMSLNSYDMTHKKTVKLSRVAEISNRNIVMNSVAVWNGSEFLKPSLPMDNNLILDNFPWFSSLINESESSQNISHHWTYPFYSCDLNSWIISNTRLENASDGSAGIVSVDIDLSSLEINQCNSETKRSDDEIFAFYGSHKCSEKTTKCDYRPRSAWNNASDAGWARGSYVCVCLIGFYSLTYPNGINGSLIEVAFEESLEKNVSDWISAFECQQCQEGCDTCSGPEPCLASYNWPFRITLLIISVSCAIVTVVLAVYTRVHRRAKVFKVASPVFLSITLFGCATMYMEMAAIFPVLDTSSCIATKWTRHMGFCITYTALLMKTWRVSLTYRVKSAHKLKLKDRQLLQWMAPVLLIMLVYLATWTLSATPYAEYITDENGLKFKQCSFNWWDHSLGIGEILFLLWGVRVCYRVRHAESLYNEARQISFAIYNIAFINLTMLAFHIQILPKASPDIKYLLGFIRIQLSTTTTILLVFAPKILTIVKGNEDTREGRVSASINGPGLVPEEPRDVYQENEELKEEIQKLASHIEFMKTVQMVLHNRHLKPKPSSYFSSTVSPRNTFHDISGPF